MNMGCMHSINRSLSLVEAEESYYKGDFTRSFRLTEAMAYQGEKKAEYTLGYMYYYGIGAPQNKQLGIAWMLESAKKGYPPAQVALNIIQNSSNTSISAHSPTSENAQNDFQATPKATNDNDSFRQLLGNTEVAVERIQTASSAKADFHRLLSNMQTDEWENENSLEVNHLQAVCRHDGATQKQVDTKATLGKQEALAPVSVKAIKRISSKVAPKGEQAVDNTKSSDLLKYESKISAKEESKTSKEALSLEGFLALTFDVANLFTGKKL